MMLHYYKQISCKNQRKAKWRTLTLARRPLVIGCFFGPRLFGTPESTSSASSTPSFSVVLTSGSRPVDDVIMTSSLNGDVVLSTSWEKMTSYGSFSSSPPGVISIGICAVADTEYTTGETVKVRNTCFTIHCTYNHLRTAQVRYIRSL